MLFKVASFNQLRTEKTALQSRYSQLEQVTHEKDIQVASLGSIANEVSVIYGLKPNSKLLAENDQPLKPEQVTDAINGLYALRSSALTGAATAGLGMGLTRQASLVRLGGSHHGSDLVAGDGTDHRPVRSAHRPVQR